MIRVYHVKNPTFFASENPKLANLHAVAEVNVHSLEQAYFLTNTIDHQWIDNPEVKFLGCHRHGMDGCRSSSVGDVFEHVDAPPGDHRWYMVDSLGFKKVNIK